MRTRSAALTLTAVLVLAACGGEDESPPADAAPPASAGGSDGAEAADTPSDLAVATTDLGDVLVDGDGMTLYLFTVDPEGGSTCEDDCADAWPPLVVDGEPVVGEGVDPSLVATFERSDGSTQVSYGGAALYTWASDREAGDVTGQGVNDVWFVVAPDGEPVTGTADEPEDEPADEASTGELGY